MQTSGYWQEELACRVYASLDCIQARAQRRLTSLFLQVHTCDVLQTNMLWRRTELQRSAFKPASLSMLNVAPLACPV